MAAELVDKRLWKLKGSKGKKMLKGNNARDAVTAVVKRFFARLEPESARTIYEMTSSGEEFDTIKDHLDTHKMDSVGKSAQNASLLTSIAVRARAAI